MIYLDNAATSFPKPEGVYTAVEQCMQTYCANPGRGSHAMSVKSAFVVNDTRERLARLLNVKDYLNICFTKNATEALNIAINGCLTAGSHVITTCMEHNSVLRPLHTLEKYQGIKLTIVDGNKYGQIDPQQIQKVITKKTRLIVCTLSSNVNGVILPVAQIGKIARENGILFLLDASQGLGSLPVDQESMHADMIAFPGHKGLMGPQGTGGLYIAPTLSIRPLMAGGTGSRSELLYQPELVPDKYESGTLNTPGLAGLGAGLEFIEKTGLEIIRSRKDALTQRLYDGIAQNRHITMYSPASVKENSGVVAFNIKGTDSTEIAQLLDKKYDIASRPGLHCAPLAHKHFGTQVSGILRLSVGYFNTASDIDAAVRAVNQIAKTK